MSSPGVEVILRDTMTPNAPPTDTAAWFACGIAEKGPAAPVKVTSIGSFLRQLGIRQSDSPLYDAVDAFFREGGAVAWVSRVLGPSAAQSTVTLNDASAGASLTVKAASAGEWGDDLTVQVTAGDAGGEFILVIALSGTTVETSPSLATVADAATWSEASEYVAITAAGANDPAVVSATSLTGGTDDRASVVDADWQTAIDRFTKELGPGQVSYPGRTTSAAHGQLLTHAGANNRVALLDAVSSGTAATLVSAAAAVRTNAEAKRGAMFAPWPTMVGAGGVGTRSVPTSGVVAGIIARVDRTDGPQQAAAGDNGLSLTALSVPYAWTDAERETLNTASVNVIREQYGQRKVYGFRSLVNGETSPAWRDFTAARMVMAITAQADAIGERFMFRTIDGRGFTIGEFGASLAAMLRAHYDRGALYGDVADEAYRVDVGPSVNTPESIAAGELRAVIAFRVSPTAEYVVVELVKAPTQEVI